MRYLPTELRTLAERLLEAAGMARDLAPTVAEVLVEGDLLGHDTHGLALLPAYLSQLDSGDMTRSGEPSVLSDHCTVAVWDGLWLPGPWLVVRALDEATRRARQFGVSIIAIRRSHHIACLQAYLQHITEQNLMAFVSCSDPSGATVAPFGSVDPVFQPDPFAVGIPTDGDPILIDTSSSITSNSMIARTAAEGGRLPGKWVQDAQGNASDDPSVVDATPPGTLLLTGGQDHGHKGMSMALIVESMAFGLSGYGRANPEQRWGASVLVQVIDPDLFTGFDSFVEQSGDLSRRVRDARPRVGNNAARLPGERALANKRSALEGGLRLPPGIAEELNMLATTFGVRPVMPIVGSEGR